MSISGLKPDGHLRPTCLVYAYIPLDAVNAAANNLQAIAGFAVVKFISTTLPETFPILGGSFGPRENNICQTAAMASGGLSNAFVSAFPAMYQLNLLGETPKADYLKIVGLTAVSGYFGYFFATPSKY